MSFSWRGYQYIVPLNGFEMSNGLGKTFHCETNTHHTKGRVAERQHWTDTISATGNQGIAFLNSLCLMVEWNKTRRIPFSPDKSWWYTKAEEWSVNDLEDALSYVCVWHGYWDSCALLLCSCWYGGGIWREDISHGFNVWKLLKTGSQGCSHELWGAVWMMGLLHLSLSALGSFFILFSSSEAPQLFSSSVCRRTYTSIQSNTQPSKHECEAKNVKFTYSKARA